MNSAFTPIRNSFLWLSCWPLGLKSPTRQFLSVRGAIYLALVVAGGYLIYVRAPQWSMHLGISYSTAFVTIFAVINFHHFLTDRAIWKLRDPKVRDVLLS